MFCTGFGESVSVLLKLDGEIESGALQSQNSVSINLVNKLVQFGSIVLESIIPLTKRQ